MPRRPSGRRLLKHQPLAFSPFMRLLALASTSRRKVPHPKDSQCSEEISFDERLLPSLSKKEQKEQLSDSFDEEDSEDLVIVDLEFFEPKPTDFHGVKMLLNNYLDDKEWDLSSFADLIVEQTTVGTMVKQADAEDENVFAFVSVLNLARYKENKCFRELKEYLLQVCSERSIASDLKLLLEENAQDVGILVSERVINFPLPFLPPLYDGLFDDVSLATKDEPTEEPRSSFRFKTYLLVTKIIKQGNPNQREPDTPFTNFEDEIFLKLSSWSFTFPLRLQQVTDQEYKVMGLVMAVEAEKIHEFKQMLKSRIDELSDDEE